MTAGGLRLWVAVERLPEILALYPEAVTDARVRVPAEYAQVRWEREAALTEVLKARLARSDQIGRGLGARAPCPRERGQGRAPCPGSARSRAARLLHRRRVEYGGEIEWCDRRLLARIHRYTVGKARPLRAARRPEETRLYRLQGGAVASFGYSGTLTQVRASLIAANTGTDVQDLAGKHRSGCSRASPSSGTRSRPGYPALNIDPGAVTR